MARKTKQESALTRQRILDAAEVEMQAHGASRTSLARIAQRAEVTRGAIYWHFADKHAVVEAMVKRTHLPLRDLRDDLARHIPRSDPKRLLREMLLHTVRRLASDEQHRRVCHIVLHKNESDQTGDAVRTLVGPLFAESRAALMELCDEITPTRGATHKLEAEDAADVILAFICGLYESTIRHGCLRAASHNGEAKIDALIAGLFAA